MHLELRTPDRALFDGNVERVTLSGTDGQFQVLDRHANLLGCLSEGLIACQTDQKQHLFQVGRGIAEVHNHRLRVWVESGTEAKK